MNIAGHQDAAQRAHRRKFKISGSAAQNRFSAAVKMLGEDEEAVLLALGLVSKQPLMVLADIRAALLLLLEGE